MSKLTGNACIANEYCIFHLIPTHAYTHSFKQQVSALCTGEYPDNITVNILNTTNAILNNTNLSTQITDQLMITGVITIPNNFDAFFVNVSFSNLGGELVPIPSFGFG